MSERKSLFSSPAEAVAWMRQWASTLTYEGDKLRAAADLLETNASVQWGDLSSSMAERERKERLVGAVRRFIAYADEYPQDISGPLADDFLPMLRRAMETADV